MRLGWRFETKGRRRKGDGMVRMKIRKIHKRKGRIRMRIGIVRNSKDKSKKMDRRRTLKGEGKDEDKKG